MEKMGVDGNLFSLHGERDRKDRMALPGKGATQAPVIDAHTHIFPPAIIEKRHEIAATDVGFSRIYHNPTARMKDHAALLEYMSRENVTASVVCGFPFQDKNLIKLTNDYIIDVAEKCDGIIPLASVSIAQDGIGAEEAQRCLDSGAFGIGEVAFYERRLDHYALRRLEEVARIAAKKDAPILIHMNEQVGHAYNGKASIDFAEVSRFIEANQDLDIVLAHLGGGLCFYEFMPEIRTSFSRVSYDVAALPYIYSDSVYKFIDEFLSDKILFGSDFPLLSLQHYLKGIYGMKDEGRLKIMSENARRIFRYG